MNPVAHTATNHAADPVSPAEVRLSMSASLMPVPHRPRFRQRPPPGAPATGGGIASLATGGGSWQAEPLQAACAWSHSSIGFPRDPAGAPSGSERGRIRPRRRPILVAEVTGGSGDTGDGQQPSVTVLMVSDVVVVHAPVDQLAAIVRVEGQNGCSSCPSPRRVRSIFAVVHPCSASARTPRSAPSCRACSACRWITARDARRARRR